MTGDILVINSGSSSIKFSLYKASRDLTLLGHGEIEGIGGDGRLIAFNEFGEQLVDQVLTANLSHAEGLSELIEWGRKRTELSDIAAIGHRVVHGGLRFSTPVLIDDMTLTELERLIPLAPLHQHNNIAGINACSELLPGVPQVACFDTAFHRNQPVIEQQYALPKELTEAGICRYGFHGLSYEYIAGVLPGYLGGGSGKKVIVAHLGNGASMCALLNGKSIASTMGFTALDGLPMGTRCGSLDPGVVLYLMTEKGMDSTRVTDLLYHESGLLGVSGISSDMRTLLASSNPRARQAVELFAYRISRELGSLAAALGGLDALIFTGGIGEHAAPIRERVCQHASWLGIQLDPLANAENGPCISIEGSPASAWVIATDEERVIAGYTLSLQPAD